MANEIYVTYADMNNYTYTDFHLFKNILNRGFKTPEQDMIMPADFLTEQTEFASFLRSSSSPFKNFVYKKELCDEFVVHGFNVLQPLKYSKLLKMKISVVTLVLMALVLNVDVHFCLGFVISERVEAVDTPSYEKRESPEELLQAVKLLLNLKESKNEGLERLKQIVKANGTGSSSSGLSSPVSATSSLVSSLPMGKLTFNQFLEILEKLNIYPVHEEVIQLIVSNSDRINKLYEALKEDMNGDDCGDNIFECLWDLFN
uniref:Uncharacterized protein n=1 Tax=Glossina pallidipes TaxID=7398 RepID=A0A1A9ZH32_GLOPL